MPFSFLFNQQGGDPLNTSAFFAPLNDLGDGEVNLVLTRGSGSATFTRATTAYTVLSDGVTLKEVASGVPRSRYSPAGVYLGYYSEGERTNSLLHARDLTNAAWVKVGCTALKDATGMDGVANSASTLTATAPDATCLQTLVLAAAARSYSVGIKRKTGTGTVNICRDGVTFTDVTAQVNSSTFTRVKIENSSVLNPVCGIKLATSGDEIYVDMNQDEAGVYLSSVIPTTTVAVTRNADVLTYPVAGNEDVTVGSAYCEISTDWSTDPADNGDGAQFIGAVGSIALLRVNVSAAATTIIMYDGTNAPEKTGLSSTATGVRTRAVSWGAGGISITGDGASTATGSFDGSTNATAISVGCATTGIFQMGGAIKNVRVWITKLTDAQLVTITTP